MTEEPHTPDPDDTAPTEPQPPKSDAPPPSEGVRRLTRSSSDKLIGGVSGGLGRYFGVDPILFVGLELGGAEVLECLDDPTVRLCAFAVHFGIRSLGGSSSVYEGT